VRHHLELFLFYCNFETALMVQANQLNKLGSKKVCHVIQKGAAQALSHAW
jgi:hypothetical protein